MAARHSVILMGLAAAWLTGCSAGPAAHLATSSSSLASLPVTPTVSVSLVRTVPGYKGPAPTVAVKVGAAPGPAVASAAQEAATRVITADSELEVLELLASDGNVYQLQGWFQDFADNVKRTWQRFKLKREVKAALNHKRERAFELYEGEIDKQRKNRTAPVTVINEEEDGGKEILTTWTSTQDGTWEVKTRRTIDADGNTQFLGVRKDGIDKNDLRISLERVRFLVGDDGTYDVVTKKLVAYEDGRQELSQWTKTVIPDGNELIEGFIIHRDGHRTDITGNREADGTVKVEVSKIAPVHNADPLPSASPLIDD